MMDLFGVAHPSSVSTCGRATFSHKGRRKDEARPRRPLLPLWEKVPEGRMRGRATSTGLDILNQET